MGLAISKIRLACALLAGMLLLAIPSIFASRVPGLSPPGGGDCLRDAQFSLRDSLPDPIPRV